MSEPEKQVYLVPRNLAKLGMVCATEPFRYTTNNVRVTVEGGTFKAESTDGKSAVIVEGPITEEELNLLEPGKFPDVKSVVPQGDPVASFAIDPKLLAKVLAAALPFTDECTEHVQIDFHGPEKALVIRAENEGRTFTGLVMPMTGERKYP